MVLEIAVITTINMPTGKQKTEFKEFILGAYKALYGNDGDLHINLLFPELREDRTLTHITKKHIVSVFRTVVWMWKTFKLNMEIMFYSPDIGGHDSSVLGELLRDITDPSDVKRIHILNPNTAIQSNVNKMFWSSIYIPDIFGSKTPQGNCQPVVFHGSPERQKRNMLPRSDDGFCPKRAKLDDTTDVVRQQFSNEESISHTQPIQNDPEIYQDHCGQTIITYNGLRGYYVANGFQTPHPLKNIRSPPTKPLTLVALTSCNYGFGFRQITDPNFFRIIDSYAFMPYGTSLRFIRDVKDQSILGKKTVIKFWLNRLQIFYDKEQKILFI